MKKTVDDILKNKNTEKNLCDYPERFMQIGNKYAMAHFAMNYFVTYEVFSEYGDNIYFDNQAEIAKFNLIVENAVSRGYADEKDLCGDIEILEKMREENTSKMSIFTRYIDKFNICEYALNRVEYRFRDDGYPDGYSDEAFTKKIMRYILSDENAEHINVRITEVLGQLPVRLTKGKFYEVLENGIKRYIGMTRQSIDDFVYRIESSCMLEEDALKNYPDLDAAFVKIKNADFKNISEDEFREKREILDRASSYIGKLTEASENIQNLINDLLATLYTYDANEGDEIVSVCKKIISDTNMLLLGKKDCGQVAETEKMFVSLEGVQEELYPKIMSYDITDQIMENHGGELEKLGLTEKYSRLVRLSRVISDSPFAELEPEAVNNSPAADENYIMETTLALKAKFDLVFKDTPKIINRAVMAAAISEVPQIVKNVKELQDYIYTALSSCVDRSEKLACIEILNNIMAE